MREQEYRSRETRKVVCVTGETEGDAGRGDDDLRKLGVNE